MQLGGRRVSAARCPSARALVFVTSRCGALACAPGLSPLPGHGASGTIQFMLKRHGCLRPHGQQRGQTDSAEPLGSSCASAQSVLLGVRGAGVPVLGVGMDPQGCRVPGTWSWLGPPHVQRIGVLSDPPGRVPRPTGRPAAVVGVGEGSGTLHLRVRQLVSGRRLRALLQRVEPQCRDTRATAGLGSSLLCDLGHVTEPLCASASSSVRGGQQ